MAGGSTRTQTMSRSCVDTQVENVRESATSSIYSTDLEVPADFGDLEINPTSTERPVLGEGFSVERLKKKVQRRPVLSEQQMVADTINIKQHLSTIVWTINIYQLVR